ENTVSEILWQLDDHGDRVDRVEPRWLRTAGDRGATGVDLVDFLDGYLVTGGAAGCPALQQALASRSFPYDFAGPVGCPGADRPGMVAFVVEAAVVAVVLLVLAQLRSALGRARREAERLGRERDELASRVRTAEETARRALELAAHGIEEPARDAHR